MLEGNTTYRNNDHDKVRIGGRIKEYSPDKRYVYAIGGDWYDEKTGAFLTWTPQNGHKPLSVNSRRSIKDHSPIDHETGEKR